jgi:hypothetical protein
LSSLPLWNGLIHLRIEVIGNIAGITTPSFNVGGVTFEWADSSTLVTESATTSAAAIGAILSQLQPALLYRLMAPIQLYLARPERVDIVL